MTLRAGVQQTEYRVCEHLLYCYSFWLWSASPAQGLYPHWVCLPTNYLLPWSLTSLLHHSAARRDMLCWHLCVLSESQDVRGGIQGSAWEAETCQPKLHAKINSC